MSVNELRREFDALTRAISGLRDTDSHATRLNRLAMEKLRQRIAREISEASPELDLRFQDPRRRSEMPARKLATVLSALTDAVAHAVNLKRPQPYSGTLPDAFRAMVDFRLLGIRPGSVRLHLRLPNPEIDANILASATAVSANVDIMKSVEQILDVLEVAAGSSKTATSGRALSRHLTALGPDAARNIAKLARVIADEEYSVDFEWKPEPQEGIRRSIVIGPSEARNLRDAIGEQDAQVEVNVVEGRLVTASRVRSVFDLILDDESKITGRVTKEVQRDLRRFFDRRVYAHLRETTEISQVTQVSTRRIELIYLELAEDDADS
ncbi:hypothetical protein AGRA3207_003547 [Actinomadura graeca]|uniref:Uncharacterized protein n=1 Tax=Actinomadura graeca TaxID=2750812 RepID=A0ABX8QUW0_9ACTN|nr:hypothetical protein [Actinomadura graeca]QXJ22531.1 hypothetical protein AGRA3207_003547 [Actinomadura graeca]